MRKQPKILVTTSKDQSRLSWFFIRLGIALSGGKAYRSTSEKPLKCQDYDALLLAGGSDIDPSLYGQAPKTEISFDLSRDHLEQQALKHAFEQGKPILGICRGMQTINVFFKGTLHQEVSGLFDDFLPTRSTLGKIIARHTVEITKESRLYQIMGRSSTRVNSLHHQAINQLGQDLYIASRLNNGLIQAIEHTKHPWLLGVQWHPEYMLFKASQRKIFKSFVDAARKARLAIQ